LDRLRVSHDKLTVITNEDESNLHSQEIIRILRVITVLKEYICEFDANYACERIYSPLYRAYRGKTNQIQNRQSEDIEVLTHTNETIGSIRRQIYSKFFFF
jgi:ubiquitin carboxyl-terminal hydrolase 9/24